jgi:hypothetical protein
MLMNKTFTLTTAVYVFAMLGCTFAFYAQRHVVFSNHILPGRMTAGDAVAVEITDDGATTGKRAALKFLNTDPVTNPLRMGSEMQEQLQAVLFANLATGAYLIFVHARKTPKS